jgi:hypothetical protein
MMGFFLSDLPVQHLTVQFSSQIWVQGLSLQEIYATQFLWVCFALLLCGESFKAWSITYAVSEILEVYIWVQAATSEEDIGQLITVLNKTIESWVQILFLVQ